MSAFKRKQPMMPEQALERLEELCARSEQASGELMERLRRWGISQADSDRIISSLKKRRFVDDSRFARAYVRDKILFAHWGRMKILRGLIAKRVDKDIIGAALEDMDMDAYTDNLKALIRRELSSHPDLAATYEGRTKIYRHLISRGYEPDLASRHLRQALTE